MVDHGGFFRRQWPLMQQAGLYVPHPNPTFGNPTFDAASFRVLIVRLSPFRDVDRSTPHHVLFQAVRRALPSAYVDMAFFPSHHDRQRLIQAGIPLLTGSQSFRSVDDFDLVLISNAYTLELVNLPYLLLNSGIPLMSSQRGDEWPPLILGGSNALAAQAIIAEGGDSLVDGLFFGEGEEQVVNLVRRLHAGGPKRALLAQAASRIEGLWVAGSWPPAPVDKCILAAPGADHLLADHPILNTEEAQTARLQISFGCPALCSFCFEGFDRRPYREVELAALLDAARQLKRTSGGSTLELYSFNFNTHSDILTLLLELNRLFKRVSAMSQRVDLLDQTPGLLEAEVTADKRQFTLGIEGISARQRAWLHKSLSTAAISRVLERLLQQRIRQIKLFYILTGHECVADLDEFRSFVRQLKALRQRHNPGIRVTFSFGQLVRMPFTPLRYDRLFLDPDEWRTVVGPVKSACETNGFEFRMATQWEEYCTAQVLAIGGYWLLEPLLWLARQGQHYDEQLSPGYWEELRGWLATHGHWTPALLGEKGPDYPFPLHFVRSGVSSAFLHQQYRQALAGQDDGYCLGGEAEPGNCLGCGACGDEEQRRAITGQRKRTRHTERYLTQLRELMEAKRRLSPIYVVLRLPVSLSGVGREWMNAWVLRGLLAAHPDLTENLLSAEESLFTVGENRRRYAALSGETVFALTAWDAGEAVDRLAKDVRGHARWDEEDGRGASGPQIVSVAEGFEPGRFRRARLSLALPPGEFKLAGRQLVAFLRASYVPCNIRREGVGYRLDLPARALKKGVLFEGRYQETADRFLTDLVVGPKFDLLGYVRSFDGPDRHRLAQVVISDLEW